MSRFGTMETRDLGAQACHVRSRRVHGGRRADER
jgi:hypothetical protein